MKIRMPSTGFVAGRGLDVLAEKVSPVGDVFTQGALFSVLDGEFRCSAASFSGGKAT